MATDKTDVSNKMVIAVALLSIGTLIGLRFALTDYFNRSYAEREQTVNFAHASPLLERENAATNARLSGIAAAMSAVASGQRPEAIAIRPGPQDNAALQGWTLLPHALPAHPAAAPPPAAVVPVQPADAPSTVPGPQGLAPGQLLEQGMRPAPAAPPAPPALQPEPQQHPAAATGASPTHNPAAPTVPSTAPTGEGHAPSGAPVLER